MSKKVAIPFWSIFDRVEGEEMSTSYPKPISKDLLKKIKATDSKVVVYISSGPTPVEPEGLEPEFQKELVKALMADRLKQNDMPFDEVEIERPKEVDLDIDYAITDHKNWESVLIDKLKKQRD